MPRRALVFITALVLALHWLVLSGVPLAWDSPAQPSSQVFSTRSIAPSSNWRRAKPRAVENTPQLEEPPKTITTRQHKSGKWREETKTYQPPHRGGYY